MLSPDENADLLAALTAYAWQCESAAPTPADAQQLRSLLKDEGLLLVPVSWVKKLLETLQPPA